MLHCAALVLQVGLVPVPVLYGSFGILPVRAHNQDPGSWQELHVVSIRAC